MICLQMNKTMIKIINKTIKIICNNCFQLIKRNSHKIIVNIIKTNIVLMIYQLIIKIKDLKICQKNNFKTNKINLLKIKNK